MIFDMAAVSEMGEIDDVHVSKDEGEAVLNGDMGDTDDNSDASQDANGKSQQITDNKNDYEKCNEQISMDVDDNEISKTNDNDNEKMIIEETNDCSNNKTNKQNNINNKDEVHEIIDDDDDDEDECDDSEEDDGDDNNEGDDENEDDHTTNTRRDSFVKNGINKNSDEPIELNDSGGDDGDVMIIEESTTISKENGNVNSKKRHSSDELEVIELDETPIKKKIDTKPLPTRRSTRNINKQKSYVENERDMSTPQTSEESDIEEILPQDPLAVGNDNKMEIMRRHNKNPNNTQQANSSTIVVKDTKRLVEIAAKSNNSHSGNKKEPTLVIIDTNSILSGRGPVPVGKNQTSSQTQQQSYPTILPMALPAQGMYPPNMRATITPIPMNSTGTSLSCSSSVSISSTTIKQSMNTTTPSSSTLAPVLPTLTDDMFVVEAPSFIVPYVYEKPPVSDFKDFLKEFENNLKKEREQNNEQKDDKDTKSDDDRNDNRTTKSISDDDEFKIDDDCDDKKPYSYFGSPLGKFFIDIGFNLVQEFVQSDLLKQQKRKRDREGGHNPQTNKTINSLMKNLEFSKEHNEPFKIPFKKCEFCNFKSESYLAMSHHLETPHTKNYVYKCNFCTYEVRNPHDILFHMEAEHAIRGRLERAPAFHQCPNCPFEDNQKGKLSRHLATCMKKFKPEKNLEPPLDWEPPAKIPRVPKQRQGLNVSAYQAMKTSQLQFLTKMQLLNSQNTQQHPLHRGRGRPTLGSTTNLKGQPQPTTQQMMRPSNMVYKQQTMSGGSVLVPTNYQLSGNQVFQQQNQSKNKTMHQPSISITPLPRASTTPNTNMSSSKPGDTSSKNSFVICEICDGYIKDLEQLRNHMQWIHKVKIHPKMIYNRPPLNCQKCQFRFFTDQGLERHLLGSHGLVTSSMQDAANKSKDAGRCPVCGRVYQWKLLNHVARDHNMTLKPAHLSYKCTVCTATFGMYKQFENHVYSAHSVVARRVMDKKNSSSSSTSSSSGSKNDQLMKPLKINDEITIIPQPAKSITSAGTSKESGASLSTTGSTNCRNNNPSTSKSR